MRTLITGGTGLIGRYLVGGISEPVVLSRDPDTARRLLGEVEIHEWSPNETVPLRVLEGCEAVIHLAGESVAEGRWTKEKRRRIRDSRIVGTRSLVDSIEAMARKPRVMVSASAVGFYGDRGEEILDESSGPGVGFLPDVCVEWENEASRLASSGVRVVTGRIGVVLAKDGGALTKMLPPFRFGVGGRLGDGRQWMSWIHVADVVGLILEAVENERISGPMNVVSPMAVNNTEFTRVLARFLRRPAIFPVPEMALRVLFGEMSEILLASQRVRPTVAHAAGYRFSFPTLGSALSDIVSSFAEEAA